jgi:hypothetical protein
MVFSALAIANFADMALSQPENSTVEQMDRCVLEQERNALLRDIANAEGSARELRDDLDRLEQWICECKSMETMMRVGAERTGSNNAPRVCGTNAATQCIKQEETRSCSST